MPEFAYDFESVHHITADAVGPPGRRVFYIQARQGRQLVSLVAEKEQIRALANAIDRLLDDLAEKNPSMTTMDDILVTNMSLQEPLESAFRVAQMGLGYDLDRDRVILVLQSVAEDDDEEQVILARFTASRPQMRALSTHAIRVIESGRPICGNCGNPIDPEGHFCPERNGHGPVSS